MVEGRGHRAHAGLDDEAGHGPQRPDDLRAGPPADDRGAAGVGAQPDRAGRLG